jgi:protocatechuate 3,4-dioxygenase beta subunit
MRALRIVFVLLAVVTARNAGAHNEPFILCDVTVIDTSGNPVRGAEVFAISTLWETTARKPLFEIAAETVTNFSGQARLQWPNDEKDCFVFAYKPGLSLGWSFVRSWNPRHRIFLQLGDVIPIDGLVVDEHGRPVADALVQCKPQSSSEFNDNSFSFIMNVPILKTRSGPDGRFRFDVMSEDMTTDFFVTHPEYAPHFTNAASKAFQCTYRPGQEGIVITLSKGCTVRGKVTDEAGKGLEGIPIHARLVEGTADYHGYFTTVSGENGHFTLTNLPEDTFVITTGRGRLDEQSRWPSFGRIVRTRKDRAVVAAVKVETGIPVEFVTLDETTKRPIANVLVDFYCVLKSGDMSRSVQVSDTTDASGRVTLPCFPGDSQVGAWAKGYNGMWPSPIKIDKHLKRMPIFLNPEEASISGRVVDEQGKPAAGIRIYPVFGMERHLHITDSSGRFSMQFQPNTKEVYLLAQDIEQNLYALAEVTKEQTDYTLVLQKGLTLKGKVVDEQGRPIRGALVKAMCQVPHAFGGIGYHVLSDENGEYAFRAVPPTQGKMDYWFWVYSAGYGGGEIRNIKIDDRADTFTLPELRLRAADTSVRGIVVDHKGNPMPNLPVFLSGSRGSRTAGQVHYRHATDSEGRFYFPNICRGPLTIQADGGMSPTVGSIEAVGGDQNLRVVSGKRLIHPEHLPMVGRPIPPLCFDGRTVDPNQVEGKQVVVCFWEPLEETLKRACDFARQLDAFSREDVSAHFVFIYSLRSQKNEIAEQIRWPIYDAVHWTEMDLIQRAWGAQETPWFVVTDKKHVIIYEGASARETLSALQSDGSGEGDIKNSYF